MPGLEDMVHWRADLREHDGTIASAAPAPVGSGL
jgi:hypothetical protein